MLKCKNCGCTDLRPLSRTEAVCESCKTRHTLADFNEPRSESMINWVKKDKVMTPTEPLICPFCKTELVLRWSKVIPHPDIMMEIMRMADGGEDYKELFEVWKSMPSMFSYVDDQRWKCPRCHYTVLFGIPISIDDSKELRDERHGNTSHVPVKRWLEDEFIKSRLKALGYF